MPSKGQAARIFVTGALCVVVLWTVAPYAFHTISTSAVVNAPLTPVVSQIEGVVSEPSSAAGTRVRRGAILVEVEAREADRRHLEALEADRATMRERAAAADGLRRKLRKMLQRMQRRLERHRAKTVESLLAERREATALVEAAEARADEQAATLRRKRALSENGWVADESMTAAATQTKVGEAEIAALKARARRAEARLEAARNGTFIGDGFNDVPYSKQKADELEVRLAELARERARLEARIANAERQIAAERARLGVARTFGPEAPVNGVVWHASGRNGDPVSPGQEIMRVADCERRFLEVAIDERHFDDITVGDLAKIDLKGSERALQARVAAVRGAGAKPPTEGFAAKMPTVERGQLRVFISLEGIGLDRAATAFCHIGRTAEVRLPGAVATWAPIEAFREMYDGAVAAVSGDRQPQPTPTRQQARN